MYLIKGKPDTSREELVAHWFANHMPASATSSYEAGRNERQVRAKSNLKVLFGTNDEPTQAAEGKPSQAPEEEVDEVRRKLNELFR